MLDSDLRKTEDFKRYCEYRNVDLDDPVELETFKNYIIDHGGSLEDCA